MSLIQNVTEIAFNAGNILKKHFVNGIQVEYKADNSPVTIADFESSKFLEKMLEQNVMSWNAIITTYSQNGNCNEALVFFNAIQVQGIKSNSIIMVWVISCISSH